MELLDDDGTTRELRHGLPGDCTVALLGWPEAASAALPARGDVEALVVDALGEGTGFVQQLWNSDIDAADVTVAGLGAAVAAADLLLLEAPAIGPDEFIAVAGSRAAGAVATHAQIPVWLVGGVGRQLPGALWNSLKDRLAGIREGGEPWDVDEEVVPLDLVTHIVGPTGVQSVAQALQHSACPVATELLRRGH